MDCDLLGHIFSNPNEGLALKIKQINATRRKHILVIVMDLSELEDFREQSNRTRLRPVQLLNIEFEVLIEEFSIIVSALIVNIQNEQLWFVWDASLLNNFTIKIDQVLLEIVQAITI